MTQPTSIAQQSSDQSPGETPMMGFHPSPALRASIVKWAERQPDAPALSEAVRRLVELALTSHSPSDRRREKQKTRASEMAGAAIDQLADGAVAADERSSRKRRLMKGPDEFRESRVDKPKQTR